MSITLVIVIPVMGVLYVDMWNATNAAVYEVKKMRDLRREIILKERQVNSADTGPTKKDAAEE